MRVLTSHAYILLKATFPHDKFWGPKAETDFYAGRLKQFRKITGGLGPTKPGEQVPAPKGFKPPQEQRPAHMIKLPTGKWFNPHDPSDKAHNKFTPEDHVLAGNWHGRANRNQWKKKHQDHDIMHGMSALKLLGSRPDPSDPNYPKFRSLADSTYKKHSVKGGFLDHPHHFGNMP